MKSTLAAFALLAALCPGPTVLRAANPASYQPRPEAVAALGSDPSVDFRQGGNLFYAYVPRNGSPQKGLILYPGALVDYRAYAPLAREIARQGYLVAVVQMPLDIAFLGFDRATLVRLAFRNIKTWAVGGHSLGGVAACTYVKNYPLRAKGLALLASYPAASDNLRYARQKVVSVYGTQDGLTDASDIAASVKRLPPDTMFSPVDGGNHTQFGAYWDGEQDPFLQPGDLPASVSPEAQRQAITAAIVQLLQRL